MIRNLFITIMLLLSVNSAAKGLHSDFETINSSLKWKLAFADKCTENWTKNWFLDGNHATVKNSRDGMLFAAGKEEGNDAHHAVLWTKESFSGDIKIEYDYIRTDSAVKYVNILYIQATGDGEGKFVKDISKWNNLREIPSMNTYFENMNLLHVSFAAFNNDGKGHYYVRARRYPKSEGQEFNKIVIEPSYDDKGFVKTNQLYHMTAIKSGEKLFFKMESKDGVEVFFWDISEIKPVNSGRVGLRHMYTRSAIYKNIKIYTK